MSEDNSYLVDAMPESDGPQTAYTQDEEFEVKKSTPFDSLEALLAKEIEKEPIVCAVPARKGFALRFNTNIDADLLQAWQRRCTRKGRGGKEDTDAMALAAIIITSQCEALLLNDEEQTDAEGDPINFRSTTLAKMLGASTTSNLQVLRKLYGYDGHIMVTMQEVLTAAGFDNEVDLENEENPTIRS